MNILLSCAGGMSSSIVAKGLEEEAKKHGKEFYVEATHIGKIKDKMTERKWHVILLAPQVRYRHHVIEEQFGDASPILDIEGLEYTPMGVHQLYNKIMAATNINQQ